MKKAMVTAIATTGIFIILIEMCPAMPGPMISVEPSYLTVTQGDTFTINITVEPEGIEIGGVQYGLDFDSNLLNATSQIPGTFLSQDGASTMVITNKINNTIGKTGYGEFRTSVDYGVTTSGILATITFNAMEPGTSSLSLSNEILSNPQGYQISGVSVNNGTCNIEALEQTTTSTSTPTPTSTPTQTPTPSPTLSPTSTPTPTETPNLTPAQTSMIKPVPLLSPSPSPTIITSPAPTATKPLPLSEENKRLPGFEAAFAIVGLLVISCFILKRKKGGNKK